MALHLLFPRNKIHVRAKKIASRPVLSGRFFYFYFHERRLRSERAAYINRSAKHKTVSVVEISRRRQTGFHFGKNLMAGAESKGFMDRKIRHVTETQQGLVP